MRPTKLTLQAFGPYENKSEIDFTQFDDHDIFLITGNTGAGKTALFDAISYALYGKASGENRDVDMLRNSSAQSDTETYVSLDFEYHDLPYSIRRSPRYMRDKARGEGQTEAIATAELILPTQERISGPKQVDEKILEILQINQEQFSQIVMIAQNDFLKFLSSNTSDRKEILRTIFVTSFYETFENELKLMLSIEKDLYQKEVTMYANRVSNFKGFEEEFYKLDHFNHELIVKTVEEKKTSDEKDVEQNNKVLETITKDLVLLTKELTLAQSNNKILNQYKEYELEYTELLKQKEVIKEKENLLKNIDHVIKDFITVDRDLEKSKTLLKEYESLELIKTKQGNAYEQEYKILENKIKEIKDTDDVQEKRLKRINTLENLRPEYIESDQLKENIDKIKKMIIKYENDFTHTLYQVLLKNSKQNEVYNKNLKNYEEEKLKNETLRHKYDQIETQFLSNQAGIMASTLKQDDPCPVCGSVDHPNPAIQMSDDIEKDYFEIKEQYQKMTSLLEKQRKHLEEERLVMNKSESNYEYYSQRIFDKVLTLADFNAGSHGDIIKDFDDASLQYKELQNQLNKDISLLTKYEARKEFESLKLLEEEIKTQRDLYTKREQDVKETEDKFNDLKDLMTKTKTELLNLKNQIKSELNLSKQLSDTFNRLIKDTFNSKEAYVEVKNKVDQREVIDKDIKDYYKSFNAVESLYVDYKKQASSLKDVDTKSLEIKVSELEEVQKNTRETLSNIQNLMKHNLEVLVQLDASLKSIKERENRYSDVLILSNTASGSISGKAKVQFETYAQMAYFDKVIYYANQRLDVMSNHQYELIRREDATNLRSQGGLDLDIIDHHYATVRDVKTLSGGESFNTSLALALGLSDAIQHSHGGIKIDALFIDEGFGTLSDDYLDHAIQTLVDVAGGQRLIGVISHVKELKDAIAQQIQVSKDQEGSHIKLVVN